MKRLNLSVQGDRELVVTREFNAPRQLVYEAFTRPEFVKRWLLGPDGWTMPICEIDLRVGGRYRYVWRNEATGAEMGMGGVFLEIAPPDRIVSTEKFEQSWYPGECIGTVVFTEAAGKTTLTQTLRYETPEAMQMVLKSPMEHGLAATYDRLASILEQ